MRHPRHSSRNDRSNPTAAGKPAAAGPGHLWLWGTHPVLAALANPERQCNRLLVTQEALAASKDKLAFLATQGLSQGRRLPPPEITDRKSLEAMLSPAAVHQGMALSTEPLESPLLDEVLESVGDSGTILILDQVTDPHNLGAVLRSATAFGAVAVMTTERHAPPESGTLAKSASGALELVPWVRETNLARALDQMKQAGFWIAGLDAAATQTLAAAKLSGKVGLVLGSEGDGLRRLTRDLCDLLVGLPQSGKIDSLNVSNAAAVALYELARR